MFVLMAVLAAIFFFINYGVPVVSTAKIEIEAMTSEDKQVIETGARETVKFFKNYKLALNNEIAIATISDKNAYKNLLMNKYNLPENTAELVSDGRGFYTGDTILINTKAANSDLLRVATVAHELTHHYQRQMAPNAVGLEWLQEGMADVAACDILEQSGQAQIQPLPVKQLKLPAELNLANLNTAEEWVESVNKYGANAVYAYSTLAARRLISERGFLSCINYYHELKHTRNVEASFKTAFGMALSEYQEKFSEYMQNNTENIYYYNYYR
jgi:hypothetical protein